MPLDDLTPAEIVVLVQVVKALPENVMVINENDELTMLDNHPALESFLKKLNEAGDREDVKAFIKEHYA